MKISDLHSPGLITDLEIARFENILRERDGYLVVETPGNPGFYWGNFLVFPKAPTPSDEPLWREAFRREFAHQPLVRHEAFTWDSQEQGVLFQGFAQESGAVLTLQKAHRPAHANADAVVRPLVTDADWEAATHNQVATREEGFEIEAYYRFKRAQMNRYRRMSEAGQGNWYGAFFGDKLVADCGLYLFGPTGRFQSVGTHPEHRRQGFASSLIYEVAKRGLERAQTLVIVSEQVNGAERVYRSVGFAGQELQWQLTLRPAQDQEP